LQDLGGLPLIVRVCANLKPLVTAGATLRVATDSDEVIRACAAHGYTAQMTRADHPSGTDRCHEVAQGTSHGFILNVQGDEPFVHEGDLLALCQAVSERPQAQIGTLVYRSSDEASARDPNVVKAVARDDGYALYFSRSNVPYDRDAKSRSHVAPSFWHHLGVYAYRKEALAAFCALPPADLECTEKLEQLRALANGWQIYLQAATRLTRGIDTPNDLEAARAQF
jgi:3-deoxy-manno-octulosonate cytidylyltransferase (CMP-KDO synthetase)